MRSIKIDLPKELEDISIHTFADLHIGDNFCDRERIKESVNAVKNTPNAFAILNGDIINNATKTSVSDCYAEKLTPMEQITEFVDLFEPIKDKILAMTSGNHENRTYIKEGVDITQICARQLGIEDKYARSGAVIFLRFGTPKHKHGDESRKICYTIYCTHGSGGGRKEGGKINRLADLASIIDTDVYIMSHTHLPAILKEAFYRTSLSNSSVNKVDKIFINTSAQLDYGGYGEQFNFKASSKDTPTIYLSGTRKEMTAKL